jgi:MFS family permease
MASAGALKLPVCSEIREREAIVMRDVQALWRDERQLRRFFLAQAQGSLGAGVGYVALLVLAYDRIGSAWAATAVLLADLLPSMLLAPLLGFAIDRLGRRRSAIAGELLRAVGFAGVVFAPGAAPMVAFALVAGLGSAIFRPATAALLPSLVSDARLPAANAVLAAIRSTGQLLGPALAAAALVVASPAAVMGINAATCAASALLLLRLTERAMPAESEADGEPRRGGGLRAVAAEPLVRTLVGTSGVMVLAAGMMNVAELVFARVELAAGATGYALFVSGYGCGLVAGSLLGASAADAHGLKRRYLAGALLQALGLLGSALAPGFGVAVATFAITGLGNGVFMVADRVLMQRSIPAALHGRAFGVLDSIDSWGFGAALLAGGALASAFGGRATFALAGSGALLVTIVAAYVLRRPSRAHTLAMSPAI